jgi:hypothetical protein
MSSPPKLTEAFDGSAPTRRRQREVNQYHELVESIWRGVLAVADLLPTLSSAGASLASPCFHFHTPLIEPDVRICRIQPSEKTHAITIGIACDAACDS